MATDVTGVLLLARLTIAINCLKDFLRQIDVLETDPELSPSEKLIEIKKIRDQLDKVGAEIDSVKKEIRLLNAYRVN